MQLLLAIGFYGICVIGIIEEEEHDYGIILLFSFIFITIIADSLLNLLLIKKYFPDILLSKKSKIWYKIFNFLFPPVIIMVVMMTVGSLVLEAEDSSVKQAKPIISIVFLLLSLSTFFVWIMQIQVGAFLRKKNTKKLNNLISSIGKEE